MTDTLTRRQAAHLARVHAQENGVTEGYGTRGRVGAPVVEAWLKDQPAKTVRQIANDLGVEISPKGKISADEFAAIRDFVAKNAPKA
jgi:hypothetical protein